LIDVLAVIAVSAVLAGIAVPQFTAGIERTRALGAARYLANRFALARMDAVAHSANAAVLFSADGSTFVVAGYRDGNGNGVRTRDIGSGADPLVDAPVRFSDLFPRVSLFMSDPSSGPSSETAVLMSFSAVGTSTSRTIYVRGADGSEYAVRVLGATGRTRVLRYLAASRTWIDVP
jgi:Tfp pilus assembly protein FimT